MARPLTTRPINRAQSASASAQFDPKAYSNEVELFNPPGGVRLNVPNNRITAQESSGISNLVIRDGRYSTRPPVIGLGLPIAGQAQLGITLATLTAGPEFIVVVTQHAVYRLISSSFYQQLTGPDLSLPSSASITFTAWNDKIVIATGYTPLVLVDLFAGTYAYITDSPHAWYVTTAGGRFIAGYTVDNPNRIFWSVKDNSNDWTGLGSGYEDLTATPGGVVDAVQGLFVFDDLNTMVIRVRSVWLMTQTGNVDAPFSFRELYKTAGIASAPSFVKTPYGVAGQFLDSVYLFDTQGTIKDLAGPVRSALVAATDQAPAIGCYDEYRREYMLTYTSVSGLSSYWLYSFETDHWTSGSLPFEVVGMLGQIYTSQTQGGSPYTFRGISFVTGLAGQPTLRQTYDGATTQDFNPGSGQTQAVPIEIRTGASGGNVLTGTHLVGVAIEYSAQRPTTTLVQASYDNGATWDTLGTVTCGTTAGIGLTTWHGSKTIRHGILRISASDGVGFDLVAVWTRLSDEVLLDY